MSLPSSDTKPEKDDDIFAEKSRAAWHSASDAVPRCDFAAGKITASAISPGFRAVSKWRRSLYGMELSQIKADPQMHPFFAAQMADIVKAFLGPAIKSEHFVIVAPPKRRHPGQQNFASKVCALIADYLSLRYIDDFAICKSRERIDAKFFLGADIPVQHNIIVIDDIITTGATMTAMYNLITGIGKNPLFFAGILNRK